MNLKKKITDIDGRIIQFPGKKKGEQTYKTVGEFLSAMLVQNNKYNNNLNFDKKMKQYKLAKKIKELNELPEHDIDLKKVINKSQFPMLIQMQVYEEVIK